MMTSNPPRYAENPRSQANLARWHERVGHDHTGCYRRACSVCGKVFYAGMPHASLCSERCNQNATLARRRAARRRERMRHCPRCGHAFIARRRDAIYCSNACRQAVQRQRHRNGSRPCE